MERSVAGKLTDEALEAEQHASGVQSRLDSGAIVVLQAEVERLTAQLRHMDNERGDLRVRAEVAEQEVAHLRDRLERAEALANKQGAAAQRQGDMLVAVADALGFKLREDPTVEQMVNTATMLYTAWERHQHTTARLDAERAEAIRLADELDAMATRLADQTVMLRAQQQMIDHLRRPLKARVVARVARWVRR